MTAVVLDQLAYRPAEAAKTLGIGKTKLYELIAEGEIRTLKIDSATLIRREWLIDFLDRLEAAS